MKKADKQLRPSAVFSQNNKVRATIYYRVSGSERSAQAQKGYSLQSQIEACTAYAKENGFEIVETFRETHSAKDFLDRPELSKLRENLNDGKYDVVIIYCLDRLSRGAYLKFFLDECYRNDAQLISITEPIEDTPEARLILAAKEFQSEVELIRIRERTVRGRLTKLKSGKLVKPSMDLYGYETIKDTGKRQMVGGEAATVKRIFQYYLQGHSQRAITQFLTQDEIPTPGAGKERIYTHERFRFLNNGGPNYLWQHAMIKRILTNAAYYGQTYALQTQWTEVKKKGRKRTYSRKTREQSEWIELPAGTTPAIITKEQFDAVQERLKKNVGDDTRNLDRPALLRGLIYCRCGEKMAPAWSKIHVGDYPDYTYFNYRCTHRVGGFRCEVRPSQINGQKIEAAVWKGLCRVLSEPEKMTAELDARRRKSAGGRKRVEDNLRNAEDSFSKAKADHDRMVANSLRLDPENFEVMNREIQQQKKTVERLGNMLAETQNEMASFHESNVRLDSLEKYCKDFAKVAKSELSFQQKRILVEAFVTKVVGTKGHLSMKLAIPTEPQVLLNLTKIGSKKFGNSGMITNVIIPELQNRQIVLSVPLTL